jgi:hypothetical protein
MVNDHHGSAPSILKEMKEALDRRGLSEAQLDEGFALQIMTDKGWRDSVIAPHFEELVEIFAKEVEARPNAGWRVIARHVIVVETMLVEFSQEGRGQ